jgi:uncharacterized protein YqjF (DUF2071 family)
MRSDDELDRETDKIGFRLLILLGVVIVVMAVFGFGFAYKYYTNSKTAEDEAASVSYEEVPIDKLKIKAELRRHNFPIEHPKHHVETKDGVEYWYCDEEYCWYFMAIDIETGDIVAEGNAHWPCDTDVSVVSAMLNKQTEDALNEISKGGK